MLSCSSIEALGLESRPDECGGEGGAAAMCGASADVEGRAVCLVAEVSMLVVSIAGFAYKTQSLVRSRKGGC